MNMNKFSLLALLALSACNSDLSIHPDVFGDASSSSSASSSSGQGSGGAPPVCLACEDRDGTRIIRRLETVDTPDGLSLVRFAGYHDKLRGEDCSPLAAEDANLRCLPSAKEIVDSRFIDPTCTIEVVPIADSPCEGAVPKYAIKIVKWANPCVPTGHAIYELGAKYIAPLYEKSNGSCIESPAMPNHSLYALGKKIESTEFVKLSVHALP